MRVRRVIEVPIVANGGDVRVHLATLFGAAASFHRLIATPESPQIAAFSAILRGPRPEPLLASGLHQSPKGYTGGRMTKNEFVDRVAADTGLSKKDAGAAVDSVLRSIESALGSGEEVNFTGFGKFHVAERGAREGRNPRTGATMTIAASKVPRFTAGSGLKKAVK